MPVSLFELTFGVLGDLFGRKRLLIGGALLLAVGEAVVFLSPGAGSATGTRVAVILIGQVAGRHRGGRAVPDQPGDDRLGHAHRAEPGRAASRSGSPASPSAPWSGP